MGQGQRSARAFLRRRCRSGRADRLREEILAVSALSDGNGAAALLAAMARADAAGTDRADALALLLTGGSPTATLPGSPSQHEIDRELSVFEASVEIAEALPEVPQ